MTAHADLRAWLDWYHAMGASDWVGERPVDHRATVGPAAEPDRPSDMWSPPPAAARPAAGPPPLRSTRSVVASARERAAACRSIAELERALAAVDGGAL